MMFPHELEMRHKRPEAVPAGNDSAHIIRPVSFPFDTTTGSISLAGRSKSLFSGGPSGDKITMP